MVPDVEVLEVLEYGSEDSFVDVLVGELVGLVVRDGEREAEVLVVVLTVTVLDGADSAF